MSGWLRDPITGHKSRICGLKLNGKLYLERKLLDHLAKVISLTGKDGPRPDFFSLGTLSKPLWWRQRGRGSTKDILGRTIAQHVLCKTATRNHQNLCGLRTETPTANYLTFHLVLNAAAHIRYAEVEVWRCKRSHTRHSDWNINKYCNRHLPQLSHPGYYITSVWRWGVTESWGAPDGWNTIGWGSVRDSSHVPGTISRTETFGVWSNFLRF